MNYGPLTRAIACLALLVFVACGGSNGAQPTDAPKVAERNVRFETAGGIELTGRLFGKGTVGVTLLHMFPADATSWYPAARRIAQAGYMALAFNLRGFGDAEGTRAINKAPDDIAAAREYLEGQGAKQMVYIGASMGGTASIVAAADQDPMAVVSVSAPLRFQGLDAVFVSQRVQRPVLLLAARGDDEAFMALDELNGALPNPDTKVYDGDAHGTNLLTDRPEAVDEVIGFLERYAPTSQSEPSPEA